MTVGVSDCTSASLSALCDSVNVCEMGRDKDTTTNSHNPTFTQNNTTAAELYRLIGMVEPENIQSSVPVSFKLIHTMLVTGLMDSGAGFATLDQHNGKRLTDLGIQSLLSNLVGKNADGTLTESDGKLTARLQTSPLRGGGSLDDNNSICIPLEIYGRNAYLIVPIVPLSLNLVIDYYLVKKNSLAHTLSLRQMIGINVK